MRITLVISSSEAGEAQMLASTLANYWAVKNWTVVFITFTRPNEVPSFRLDRKVQYIPLGLAGHSKYMIRALWKNARLMYRLRRAISSQATDAVISFLNISNVFTVFATRGLGIPVIVSERIEPLKNSEKEVWRRLQGWMCTAAEAVVAQTSGIGNLLPKRVQNKLRVIPNPVASAFDYAISPAEKQPSSMLALSRFTSQEGFHTLIRAFALLRLRYPSWRLTILGDGPWRTELRALCEQAGVADGVEMPGEVKDTQPFLSKTELLVFPSCHEDCGSVLRDAMAWGVVVLTTNCHTGHSEVIRNWINGVVVRSDDLEALIQAMDVLMSKEVMKKHLGANARRSMQRFDVHHVMSMWEALIIKVAHPAVQATTA